MTKELHFHLLELARAEGEVPRRDFVAKTLADLSDAEGNFDARAVANVFEVDEHPLRGFRPQEGGSFLARERSDDCFEHQVEFARLGQFTRAFWARWHELLF